MSEACSIATHQRYGLQRACRIWQVPRSTVYAHRQGWGSKRAINTHLPKKRGPMGPCSDAALVAHIRRVLAASPFQGEGYRKVWAKLLFEGIRTSKERVRRLMRQHGLQAPQRVGHPHGPKAHDGTIITETPDEMWGTDATTPLTREQGQAYVFVGWIIVRLNVRASMPRHRGIDLKHWSPFGKGSGSSGAPIHETPPPA